MAASKADGTPYDDLIIGTGAPSPATEKHAAGEAPADAPEQSTPQTADTSSSATKEVERLRGELAVERAEKESATAQRDAAITEQRRLEATLKSYKSNDAIVANLEASVNELQTELDRRDKAHSSHESGTQKLQSDLTRIRQERDDAQTELSSARGALEAQTQESKNLHAEVAALTDKVQELADDPRRTEAEKALATQYEDLEAANKEVAAAKHEAARAEANAARYEAELTKSNAENVRLAAKLEAVETEDDAIATLRDESRKAKAKARRLENTVGELREQRDADAATIEALEAKASELSELKTERRSLLRKLETRDRAIARHEAKEDDVKERIAAAVQKEQDTLTARHEKSLAAAIAKQQAASDKELAVANDKVQKLTDHSKHLESELIRIGKSSQALLDQLNAIEEQRKQEAADQKALRSDLATAERKLTTTHNQVERHKEKEAAIKERIAAAVAKESERQKGLQAKALERQDAKHQKDLTRSRTDHEADQRALRREGIRITELKQDIRRLERELDRAKAKTEAIKVQAAKDVAAAKMATGRTVRREVANTKARIAHDAAHPIKRTRSAPPKRSRRKSQPKPKQNPRAVQENTPFPEKPRSKKREAEDQFWDQLV